MRASLVTLGHLSVIDLWEEEVRLKQVHPGNTVFQKRGKDRPL